MAGTDIQSLANCPISKLSEPSYRASRSVHHGSCFGMDIMRLRPRINASGLCSRHRNRKEGKSVKKQCCVSTDTAVKYTSNSEYKCKGSLASQASNKISKPRLSTDRVSWQRCFSLVLSRLWLSPLSPPLHQSATHIRFTRKDPRSLQDGKS